MMESLGVRRFMGGEKLLKKEKFSRMNIGKFPIPKHFYKTKKLVIDSSIFIIN